MKDDNSPSIGSLFSGLGCLDRAVEIVTGGCVTWQVEQDTYRRAVLSERFPGVPSFADVVDFNAPSSPDILCGGFPCRDISDLGSKDGLNGKKSGLWREYRRLIEACKPGAVFIENVARLRIRGLDRVLQDLADLGYDAVWTTTRGRDVGLYFGRPRVFLLAIAQSARLRRVAPAWVWRFTFRNAHDTDGRDAGLAWTTDRQGREDYDGPEPGIHRSSLGSPRGVVARQRAARVYALGDTVSIPQAVAAYRWCAAQYSTHALTG